MVAATAPPRAMHFHASMHACLPLRASLAGSHTAQIPQTHVHSVHEALSGEDGWELSCMHGRRPLSHACACITLAWANAPPPLREAAPPAPHSGALHTLRRSGQTAAAHRAALTAALGYAPHRIAPPGAGAPSSRTPGTVRPAARTHRSRGPPALPAPLGCSAARCWPALPSWLRRAGGRGGGAAQRCASPTPRRATSERVQRLAYSLLSPPPSLRVSAYFSLCVALCVRVFCDADGRWRRD
eukprot:359773-Chlamydomonas_euryale.AAC.3